MKKFVYGLVIACGIAVTPALAQTETYACQYVENGGLVWEDGNWRVGRFNTGNPFFLKTEHGLLTPESVGEVFGQESVARSSPLAYVCTPAVGIEPTHQSCINYLGTALSFSTTSLAGTVAMLTGGTQPKGDSRKDTLHVAPFVCTKV